MHPHKVNHRIELGRNRPAETALFAGSLFVLGFWRMFRGWLFGHFDGIFGDEGDAQIVVALLEHWYHVYSGGAADWLSPPFFYPERHVLGFTDTYFLYGVGYSVARAFGADPYTAFMLVMAVLSCVGFFGLFRFATVELGATPASAAVGAFLFAFANMMAVKMGHAQSYCAMVLPIVLLLAASAYRAANGMLAFWTAAAAGALYALIFLTAYLTGWFATTIAALAAATYFAIRGRFYTSTVLRRALLMKRHVLVGYLVGFAAGIVPVLIVYLPIWLHGASRTFDDVATFAPRFTDLINVGSTNAIWGGAFWHAGVVGQPQRPNGEIELGYTPMVAALSLLMIVVSFRALKRDRSDRGSAWILALSISLFGFWLLQLDYFGFRPWYFVWALVPGAGAVRTTFRSQIVLALAAALVVTITLDRIRSYRKWPAWKRDVLAGALALLLVAEQTNRSEPPLFSRGRQMAWLAGLPTPPGDCRLFYVVAGASPASAPWFVHQSDAMLVAEFIDIPTVNGNSSWYPSGWGLKDPAAPDYLQGVRDWLSSHGLERGVCGLDPRAGRWISGKP